ncbi:sigma-70 family RNA polymerase sigma factor [Archangium sp.]|uniref:sigma-70 family RNA polymerase sigma factor n=1 Tax=Archangium sp. TaxID=1872627 RepID=UPI002D5A3387|nr:sigma-70 family RNA polymerase sigma factor [Archangium sp.]HYO52590.1 sigma-70 family RNA polymerase sigma factor [Archangium sp.]
MMDEPLKLAVLFLEHAPTSIATPAEATELEFLLRRTWEAGRESWPQVALPAEVFVRHLAQKLTEARAEGPLATVLEQLAIADLYLACACVHEVPTALEMLERHCLAKLPASLAYLKQPATLLDDVRQKVRMHLLLGTTGAKPQLAEYKGRGTLLSWIRVMAVRMVHKQIVPTQETPENLLAAIEAIPVPGPDPELDLIKRRYRHEFRQAAHEAFNSLSSEQRHLLRLHFIDRLSTTEMGALFRVNQSTVSRWLKDVRLAVYEETKRLLSERLDLSSREFASLLDVIASQLDLSLSQILKDEKESE